MCTIAVIGVLPILIQPVCEFNPSRKKVVVVDTSGVNIVKGSNASLESGCPPVGASYKRITSPAGDPIVAESITLPSPHRETGAA
jgi:hypothetical protein